jgi:N-hydroxyarylamine O-acetyltransferase
MRSKHKKEDLMKKYLDILGVSRKPPDIAALVELVTAHLRKIPFENISKLYYLQKFGLKDIPDLDLYLNGIQQYHFGGTCYSNNYYFFLLLKYLGYDIKLCGADMSQPNVHMVSIVTINDHEYLIDQGFGAPFLEPIPLFLKKKYIIRSGINKYELLPRDESSLSVMHMYRNNELKHGYTLKASPKQFRDFATVIQESFIESSTFMNSLLLARFFPAQKDKRKKNSLVIYNLSLTQSMGTQSSTTMLKDREELIQVVEKYFDIPGQIVAEAITPLNKLNES